MGSTIMQPKLSGYQANLEENSLSSNQNSENHEGGLSHSFSACLLYTSPSPRDLSTSRMPSSA